MNEERLIRLLEIFERPALWIALRTACDNPQRELRVQTPFVDVGQAQNMGASMLGMSALEPGALALTDRMSHFRAHDKKWRFLKVFDRRIVRHELTPANQFAAYFVRYSLKLVKSTAYSIANDDELSSYFPRFQRIMRRLNGVWDGLSSEFKYARMDTLPIDSQFLQFDPQYHIILEAYLACESI